MTVYCIRLIWMLFFPKYFNGIVDITFTALFYSIMCFAVIMTLFFAGATDARLVVKKTILYSLLLPAGLLAYGFIEHFLIHFLAHELHLESGVFSSILGAGIAFLLRLRVISLGLRVFKMTLLLKTREVDQSTRSSRLKARSQQLTD